MKDQELQEVERPFATKANGVKARTEVGVAETMMVPSSATTSTAAEEMLQKDRMLRKEEIAARMEAVGAPDFVLAPRLARASTASAKMQVQVGVPDFRLAARFVGTSTWTGAPIRGSAVGVPVFLLVATSAGTSTAPSVLGRTTRMQLWTPCVAKLLVPSRSTTTHDDPATGG